MERGAEERIARRRVKADPARFFARANLAWFFSAPVAQRLVLVRFKRVLPPGTYG
jgi:hypothetical protein